MNTDERYKILGLAGRAGAGKTTFAEAFFGEYQRRTRLTEDAAGAAIVSFADPIREISGILFGRGFYSAAEKAAPAPNAAKVFDHAFKTGIPGLGSNTVTGPQAVTGRRVLQFIGTEFGRDMIYPDIWLDVFERRFAKTPYSIVIVPDVRFDNEAALIHRLGGVVLRLVNTNLPAPTDQHPSESGLSLGAIDGELALDSAEMCQHYAEQMAVQRFELEVADHA